MSCELSTLVTAILNLLIKSSVPNIYSVQKLTIPVVLERTLRAQNSA